MEKEIEKVFKPNIEGEMDEIKRVSQFLTRHENFPVSVEEVIQSLESADEVTLTDELWSQLENTESNLITKGEFDKVLTISKHYGKSNPYKLRMKLVDDTYQRPMIVKFGDRYHLVSGNTRLSTAASMGMNPKVFIGDLNQTHSDTKEDIRAINESVEDNNGIRNSIKMLFDSTGKPSARQLKYLGIKDEETITAYMVDYHGGLDNVEDMIINDIKNYNGGEPFQMICGGYMLYPKFKSYETDDIHTYDVEIIVNVTLGEESDASLYDGTDHMVKDILTNGYWWADEVGYDHSTVDEILMEMEECIWNYYNDKLNLRDKYGIGISQVKIYGVTPTQLDV